MNQIEKLIQKEKQRQQNTLMMIPSENYTYPEVRQAVGSILMHKYAEGLPHARYYQGNQFIDQIELQTQKALKKAFDLSDDWGVNVQPHSGSEANLAVLNGLLEPNDNILSLFLPDGGHLSHGWHTDTKKITIVSKIFNVEFYRVNPDTNLIDYQQLKKIARKHKPKIIISGGTSYPREIDHQKIARIAKSINAYYLADISHEAGLIAAKTNTSPFPYADIVTMTTHKTFRGPRGAVIFAKKDLISNINRGVFPGLQGGPHLHTIAGIGIAAQKTTTNSFQKYATQTIKNAQTLAQQLLQNNFDVITKGTDKHLILINLKNKNLDGATAATLLEKVGIIINKNVVPYDTGSANQPSGIRLGTPAITVRGLKEKDMKKLADIISQTLSPNPNLKLLEKQVQKICTQHPINL